jgi:hypothetical protein
VTSPPVEQVLPAEWQNHLDAAEVVDGTSAENFLALVADLLGRPVDGNAKNGLASVLAKNSKVDPRDLYFPVVGFVKGWVSRLPATRAAEAALTEHLNKLLSSRKSSRARRPI